MAGDDLSVVNRMRAQEANDPDPYFLSALTALRNRTMNKWGMNRGDAQAPVLPPPNAGTFNMARPPMTPLEQMKMAMNLSTDPMQMAASASSMTDNSGPAPSVVSRQARAGTTRKVVPDEPAPVRLPWQQQQPVDTSGKAQEVGEVNDLNSLIRAMLNPRSKEDKGNDFLSAVFAGMAGGNDPTFLGSLGKSVSGAYAQGREMDKEHRGEGKDALKMLLNLQELGDNKDYRSAVIENQKEELAIKRDAIAKDYAVGMARVHASGDRSSMMAFRASKAALDGLLKQEQQILKLGIAASPQDMQRLQDIRGQIAQYRAQMKELSGLDADTPAAGIGGQPIDVDMNAPDYGASKYSMNNNATAAIAQQPITFNGGIGTIVP